MSESLCARARVCVFVRVCVRASCHSTHRPCASPSCPGLRTNASHTNRVQTTTAHRKANLTMQQIADRPITTEQQTNQSRDQRQPTSGDGEQTRGQVKRASMQTNNETKQPPSKQTHKQPNNQRSRNHTSKNRQPNNGLNHPTNERGNTRAKPVNKQQAPTKIHTHTPANSRSRKHTTKQTMDLPVKTTKQPNNKKTQPPNRANEPTRK